MRRLHLDLEGERKVRKEPSSGQVLQEDQDIQTEKMTFEKPASLIEKATFQSGIYIIGDVYKYSH